MKVTANWTQEAQVAFAMTVMHTEQCRNSQINRDFISQRPQDLVIYSHKAPEKWRDKDFLNLLRDIKFPGSTERQAT